MLTLSNKITSVLTGIHTTSFHFITCKKYTQTRLLILKQADGGTVCLLLSETENHFTNKPLPYTLFYGCKSDKFQMKNCDIFSYLCSKLRLSEHVRTRRFYYVPSVWVLEQKNENNVYTTVNLNVSL